MGMTDFERRVVDCYTKHGWKVLRNGWPDFLMVRGDEAVAVEAKMNYDVLSGEQTRMQAALVSAGFPVITVYPQDVALLEKLAGPAPVRRTRMLRGTARNAERLRRELMKKLHEVQVLVSELAACGGVSDANSTNLAQSENKAA